MKLRIRGNSLRLRLTRTEVDDFSRRGHVSDGIEFGSGAALSYSLRRCPASRAITASFGDGRIEVRVPDADAQAWAQTEAVSLRGGAAGPGAPSILIEKDFACLIQREGEDDSDAFRNPLAEASTP
jgi:hypothetical protein